MSNPDRRRVWPAPNRLVRHSLTRRAIPADGIEVEWSTYWERRLLAGDITLKKPEPSAEEAEPAEPPAPPAPAGTAVTPAGKQSSKGA